MLRVMRNDVLELSFSSSKAHARPFAGVEFTVRFNDPDGAERSVPGFWAGDNVWKVRFAGDREGMHRYRTECSDAGDDGLQGRTGAFEVVPYTGANPLRARGRLRVSADKRYLAHADGTPFFWLGDTWWFGLCQRLAWPDEFQALTTDRVQKGFNVIQIVAGLYPDVPPDLDPRGANEAGFPLNADFSEINPAYFDHADLRIAHLVQRGLMPAIVGGWGYWILTLGIEKMRRFWRYLVARWGACPVVWCLAGEAAMPYYLSQTKKEDAQKQREAWTELGRYVREVDGHRNLIAIHPTRYGRDQVTDDRVLDLEWLQTGHGGSKDLGRHVESVLLAAARQPHMPVVVSEANYEGICGHAWQEVQRASFWSGVLSGACGHTYGANGIWQFNRPGEPFGPSPHGRNWGETPWAEAAQWPGSSQVGHAAQCLRGLSWWEMRPHPEWVEGPASAKNPGGVYAAGIPGKLRVLYYPFIWDPVTLKGIEPDIHYTASYFDPTSGREIQLGRVTPNPEGSWTPPLPGVMHDWVVILRGPA